MDASLVSGEGANKIKEKGRERHKERENKRRA